MRGKAILGRFSSVSSIVLVCLLLVLAFGCKRKAEEAGVAGEPVESKDKRQEVISEEQTKDFGSKEKTKEIVFSLDEISAFEVGEQLLHEFVRGQRGDYGEQPEAEVKVYPAFKSDKPVYGSVRFASEYGEKNSGIQYHFVVDESTGTGKGYDLLYFDLNHDRDLTNDTPLAPLKNPPDGAILNYKSIKQQVCFDYLDVNFDFGSAGQRPLEIMPRLIISESGYTVLSFVTTKARKGEIEIAGQRYNVFLGHIYLIGGWFDRPSTALRLVPDYGRQPGWWGGYRLTAMHKIGGTFYCFSATPVGDKLIVRPYDGALGLFEVGAGGRNIQKIGVKGSLRSKDTAVAVGGELEHGWPKEAQSCRLPVGDYLPSYLRIRFGRLNIFISDNYHADGKPRDRAGRPHVYGIEIRKDKPFVFDFTNTPEVMFALPPKDHRVKLGEELTVKAILTDPKLDIMIRDLDDTSSMADSYGPDGKKRPYQKALSLDPKVVITRADGEKVAEGVMPFG